MTNPARAAARALTAAALFLGAAGAAGADEPAPQYLVAYRAYDAALEAGDHAAAVRHARAAWQAAEQALGDDRLTAILAFNYGRLAVFEDVAGAHPALRRARELLDAGIADIPADEAELYASYAEFAADGPTWREANRLRESLRAFPLDAPDLNADLAPMWLKLALYDALEKHYHHAEESAAMAERAILAASLEAKQALAQAILIQSVVHLVPYPRRVKDVQAAHNDIERALRLFEPQDDIDGFDPLFAQVLAWDHAANSALHALSVDDYPDHEGTDWKEKEYVPIFSYQETVDCPKLEWEREAPRYPSRALRKGYIGAAFIGFRLAEDGTVEDARILAEVPQETFGEVALDAVKQWHLKEVPPADPACFRNQTTAIQFIIEN